MRKLNSDKYHDTHIVDSAKAVDADGPSEAGLEGDFRETPGSLFGKKAQEPLSGGMKYFIIKELIGESDHGESDLKLRQGPSAKIIHDRGGRKSAPKLTPSLLPGSRELAGLEAQSAGNYLTPNQVIPNRQEDGSSMYDPNSMMQSSDHFSAIKLQENPTAHLASSSQHSFHVLDASLTGNGAGSQAN